MKPQELDDMLRQTLQDRRLSRSEKQALQAVFADLPREEDALALLRSRAFAVAHEQLEGRENHLVLDWLEDVVRAIRSGAPPREATVAAAAYFAPDDDCPSVIAGLFRDARRSVDVCVFTITDDRLSAAVLAAHARGVAVRIITDDEKAGDLGSDIAGLARAGIPVRTDRSAAHMHHKFALFDRRAVLTGSYNWTRGAARDNGENIVVTGDSRLVERFDGHFERLWRRLQEGAPSSAKTG